MFVCCESVPYVGDWNRETWTLLVEKHTTKIEKLRNLFFQGFDFALGFFIVSFFVRLGEPAYCAHWGS